MRLVHVGVSEHLNLFVLLLVTVASRNGAIGQGYMTGGTNCNDTMSLHLLASLCHLGP